MPEKVKVAYSGKRCPWTIKMPWLIGGPVTFDQSREAVMVKEDAIRLCAENYTDFTIVGVVKPRKRKKKVVEPKVVEASATLSPPKTEDEPKE